jgi:peptidoglycan/LPS O-acetylase OafA/YrhL
MACYLAFPLVISLLALGRRSGRGRALLFCILAAGTAICCAIPGGPVRLILFLSGILLYEVIAHGKFRTPGGTVALLALVVGLLSTLLPISGSVGYALKTCILLTSFFALRFSCFDDPNAWLGTAFSWTPISWLGNMSYFVLLAAWPRAPGSVSRTWFSLPSDRTRVFLLACDASIEVCADFGSVGFSVPANRTTIFVDVERRSKTGRRLIRQCRQGTSDLVKL